MGKSIKMGQENGTDYTFRCVIIPRHVMWPKREVKHKNLFPSAFH